MKRLLLALLLFSSPVYSQLTEEGAKKMAQLFEVNLEKNK